MSTKILFLWLEGPLQSWGDHSRFLTRETGRFPTKSGVTGLIFCALGWSGSQEDRLEELAKLRMSVISFSPKNIKPTVLEDFHMVGNGYDDSDPWETLLIPKTSEGKKAVNGGAKLTYRSYLQDAHFAVFFEIPETWRMLVEQALQFPKWDLYLGRKSCAPSSQIFQGTFDSFEQAEAAFCSQLTEKETEPWVLLEKVTDADHLGLDVEVVTDVPVRFGREKLYRERFIRRQSLSDVTL